MTRKPNALIDDSTSVRYIIDAEIIRRAEYENKRFVTIWFDSNDTVHELHISVPLGIFNRKKVGDHVTITVEL